MDYQLCDITTAERLLKKHGFTFSKALGQNFIIDDSVCPAMAQALCADDSTGVLEIGPGIGVLTKELSRVAGKVCAVELDRRLFPVLSETLADFDNITLVEGDAMSLDLAALINEQFKDCQSVKICANLPYYITSPLIMRLLESRLPIDEIIVMVQKEAAERLCAVPGTREAGAVSAAVSFYGDAAVLFGVGRESFFPAPKVDSAVIQIALHPTPKYRVDDEKQFFALIRAAFSQRRKTAVNAISATLGLPKATVTNAMEHAGLNPAVRAEKITMEEYVSLYGFLYGNGKEG